MGNLLFVPDGEIGPQAFIKGAVILLATNFVLWMSWHLGISIGILTSMVSLVLVYCWACLFIKRFRYAGKSGWLFLPVFIGFVIVSYILAQIFVVMLTDRELLMELANFQKEMDPENPDVEYLFGIFDKMRRVIVLPYSAAYLLTGAAFAFGVNKLLKSRPE